MSKMHSTRQKGNNTSQHAQLDELIGVVETAGKKRATAYQTVENNPTDAAFLAVCSG